MIIITKTPIRLSFLGGGTDYPDYFLKHGGQTLGAAINQYSYVTVKKLIDLFEYSMRVGYSRTELINSIEEIQHPSVRECLRFTNITKNIEINYVGDLPARSGLGSSSSFTVGLLHALHALKGELISKQALASEAVYVEQEMIKERVGVQDQYTAACGGVLNLKFSTNGDIDVYQLPLKKNRLDDIQNHLVLFYTGIRRYAHVVLEEQCSKTKKGDINCQLNDLHGLVDEGVRLLTGDASIIEFGKLLHEAWLLKKQFSSTITNDVIDYYYSTAIKAGAVGGKLLGAGGGGFLLFVVPPEKRIAVERAVGLRIAPFNFDYNGTKILFYDPE